MFRKKKERHYHVDPEINDATVKSIIFFKFNSGSSGASLHALLGRTTELTSWADVLTATRIFRHICVGFVHPVLDTQLALLLTHVEDLRVIYPGIPINKWIHILHKKFATIREVSGLLALDSSKDLGMILEDLFMIDHESKEFCEAALHTSFGVRARQDVISASSPMKKQRNSVTSNRGSATLLVNPVSGKTTNRTNLLKPKLRGEYPCFHWICNRAPCFDSLTCAVVTPSAGGKHRNSKPRPHLFDTVDHGVEADFRAWVLKYANY